MSPVPKKKEKRADYVSRFMSSAKAKKSFPSKKQRLAVAFSEWRRKKYGKKKR